MLHNAALFQHSLMACGYALPWRHAGGANTGCGPSRTPRAGCCSGLRSAPHSPKGQGVRLHAYLKLEHGDTGKPIHVFGCEHLQREDHIGTFILQQRPDVVLVETACTPEHGARPGAVLRAEDYHPGPSGMFLRMFTGVAAQLRDESHPWTSSLWQQATLNFSGEQLAYIAALTQAVPLVFCDQPKMVTYSRLLTSLTTQQLDMAFGMQSALNYQEALTGSPGDPDLNNLGPVDSILLKEREVVMCGVADEVCRGVVDIGPGRGPPQSVVIVVGAAHVPGLEALWTSGDWRVLLGAEQVQESPLVQPCGAEELRAVVEGPDGGVKRALLERTLALSVSEEVLIDLERYLPPVPPHQLESYQWCSEIYGSPRMWLAPLPEPLLRQICGGYHCDMNQVLEPLRALRPVNGGPGWHPDIALSLRSLNFELD